MTIPATYLRNTVGGAFTAGKVGGVAAGINSTTDTSNGKPITRTHTVMDNAIEGHTERRSSIVVENTGVNDGAYNTAKCLSGGTFAYDQVAFMIRTVATTINGSASNVLLFSASRSRKANAKREKMYGAKTLTAWRNRGWNPLGISGQRQNWDANATGVNSNGVLDALNDTFKSTTDNTAASSDDALNNGSTSSVPQEISYAYPGPDIKQDEYKQRHLT